MKKFAVLLLAAAMAFTFAGTAMAQNTVELKNVINDGNMRVVWPLVYSDMGKTGASAYLVANDPWLGAWSATGTTVFGISNERTDGGGTEMLAVQLTDLGTDALAGTTPIGPPQLLSGTTSTMILYVISPTAVANTAANGGASIYRIDGGTGEIISAGVPYSGFQAGPMQPGGAHGGVLVQTITGNTPWSVAPLTLDWDEASSAASIYGVSGTTIGISTGVSVWRRSSAALALPTATGTTVFNQASGVSSVYAAPVISGNSLFVVGYHVAGGTPGVSVFQFDKRDLTAGGDNIYGAALNSANVIEPNGMLNAAVGQITPTPVAQSEGTSGGTLYVVDWSGGVTLYDTQNLAQLNAYDYVKSTSGVTASPVASDKRLLIPWTTSVSCFATNPGAETVAGGSGVSEIWAYDFDEGAGVADGRYQIWSTPIISNGYAWVTVLDTASANAATIWRFDINDGTRSVVSTEPQTYAAPIVVGDYVNNDDNENGFLWFCSYNPVVDRIDQSRWAEANPYWAQYKFDAAKTGENTLVRADDDDVILDDDSGCFLSTIK